MTQNYSDLVGYAEMDPFKLKAQDAAKTTDVAIADSEYIPVGWSRGESAYLIEYTDHFLGMVTEGLGTKNRILEQLLRYIAAERDHAAAHWASLAQDAGAMIVNDLGTLGIRPLVVQMYLAVGRSTWFNQDDCVEGLLSGWAEMCRQSMAVWGGGETPTLRDIILPNTVDLGGAAMGEIRPKNRLIRGNIQAGDKIILLHSSGIHANGITLVRDLLDASSYKQVMPSGGDFVEALLQPTPIYVRAVQALLDAGIELHYCANITGHGWRKIMRARTEQAFDYIITQLTPVQELFEHIMHLSGLSLRDMYADYNMGAGFAFFVAEADRFKARKILDSIGYPHTDAGHVAESDYTQVILDELNEVFEADTLQVR